MQTQERNSMPQYETQTQNGRLFIRLKGQALAEHDIQCYGPIPREKSELVARVYYHLVQMERGKPTPETILTDDPAALTRMLLKIYEVTYKGLMVGSPKLKEPYRLHAAPRYETSVNFDDSETEHPFCGQADLLAMLRTTQERYRAEGQVLVSGWVRSAKELCGRSPTGEELANWPNRGRSLSFVAWRPPKPAPSTIAASTSIGRIEGMVMQIQVPHAESFLRGQRDGQLLAEDCPGRSESDLRAEAELQLRLLSSAGVILQAPGEYVQGLFAGYQTA